MMFRVVRALRGVAVVACIAASVAEAQSSTLLTNGRIRLLDANGTVATSVLLTNGRVAAINDATAARRAGVTTVDLHGATVVPAFTDHHAHLFGVGLWLLNDLEHERLFLDLSTVTSLADLQRRVAERARITPAGGWILGSGWNQAAWGTQAMPGPGLLDSASGGHPVFLARSDGHAGWVNTAALQRAHVTNRADGAVLEGDNEPFIGVIPALSDADVRRAFRLAAEAFAARGIVEMYDAGALGFPGVAAMNADLGRYLRLLVAEDAARPLPLRINLMIPGPSALTDSLLGLRRHDWRLSPRIRITHLKLFADGALGSRGAALTHPYADDSTTRGVARMTSASIATMAIRALDAGLGVATHAIGDEAVKRALDAYDTVLAARPATVRGRLRIEHFSYAREADLARAARMGIVLSIQSNFNSGLHDDPPFGAMRVGAANEPRVYAWARLAELGAQLAEGSDAFAHLGAPLAGFEAALTRRNAIGPARAEAVARPMLLAMQAARRTPTGERVDPTIRVGSAADFAVLSDDPLTVPVEALARVSVLRTYANGREVHGPDATPSNAPTRQRGTRSFAEALGGAASAPPAPVTGPPSERCALSSAALPAGFTRRSLPNAKLTLRLPAGAPLSSLPYNDLALDILDGASPAIGLIATFLPERDRTDASVFGWSGVRASSRCRVTTTSNSTTVDWTLVDHDGSWPFGQFSAEAHVTRPGTPLLVIGFSAPTALLRSALVASVTLDVQARR
jgi:predicted amidohydrolase YtcJ